ncbi:MAG TPA: M48 family metalloprotease [Gaiellaceae bacterium]|nr:M48 family metalloprotease [Gaiellaceae bacterium]
MRIRKAATLAVAAGVWCTCAWLLARTSVPSLDVSGLDVHRYFSQRSLDRAASYTRGVQLLWLLSTAATLAVLVVLARLLPARARSIGLGRIGSAVILGMVLIVALWFVGLPFSFAELWWQHHWGLGPFDVLAWLGGQWSMLAPAALSALATIVLLVGLAGRFRHWWLVATPVVVVIAAFFLFVSGWLQASGTDPLRNRQLAADARRMERLEHVTGTPVSVQDVSKWTDQPNAFTVGFGPSAHVVIWNTLLDGRFTRGEQVVVIAHELGHVRSRHILKGIGWTALVALPTLWILALATRRRGGVSEAANLPFVILLLTVIGLLTTPVQNLVSRRYEAEADWRALNATRDPASARKLFQTFERTSLENPSPPTWDYLWLETHPTLAQRIAMVEQWKRKAG